MGQKNVKPSGTKTFEEDYKYLAYCTPFSEDKLKQLYDDFIKDFPSGKMTQEEFERNHEKWNREVTSGDANRFAAHLFRTFDKDVSGEIDFAEFACYLCINEYGGEVDKLRWVFQMYDMDGSGKITEDELREIVRLSYSMLDSHHEKPKETWEDMSTRLFRLMDTELLRQINIEAFIDTAQTDPEFKKLIQLIVDMK